MPSSADVRRGSIPSRYVDRRFDGYHPASDSQRRALEQARAFAAGEIRSLVLVGDVGVGKSHLAAAAVHADFARQHEAHEQALAAHQAEFASFKARETEAMADHWRRIEAGEQSSYPSMLAPRAPQPPVAPRWVNVPALLTDLRSEFGATDRPIEDWVRELRESRGVVVLDDLGREKVSDWTGELVYTLVNARYEAGLPTIATSNLTPEQLRDSGYWPAVSRLAEDGALVAISGPDHRIAA